jgi:hypothetical protein
VSDSLEQVLADWRGDAAVLRRTGHPAMADAIERLCTAVGRSAEDYLTWLSESEAALHSGHQAVWFRSRYPGWEAQGLAEKRSGRRYYRQIIVPGRPNLDAARAAARRAARESA